MRHIEVNNDDLHEKLEAAYGEIARLKQELAEVKAKTPVKDSEAPWSYAVKYTYVTKGTTTTEIEIPF